MQSSPNLQGFVLPTVVNPPDTICYQIEVPNDPAYIQAFYGVLYDLTLWTSWQRDTAHTGILAADVWKKIWLYVVTHPNNCGPAVMVGADTGDDMAIRQNPDNPCEIQSSADGTHWCTFIDLSLCFGVPQQPGGGQTQPKPGECAKYHAMLPGDQTWLLPTGVSTGDTIEVSAAGGSTNDAGTVDWYCPDGSQFILGFCTGFSSLSGSDPLPSVKHQKLIALIGSTYYDVFNGIFTVPAGHSNDQVTFQVNNNSLTGNSGSYEFDVNVCNNGSSLINITYSHGSGPTSVPYGSAIIITAQDIGSDVRIDASFDRPVKTTILAESGYANTGTPGPGNVWCGGTLGTTQIFTLANPPNTTPLDWPANSTITSFGMDTGAPGSVFTITIQLDHP